MASRLNSASSIIPPEGSFRKAGRGKNSTTKVTLDVSSDPISDKYDKESIEQERNIPLTRHHSDHYSPQFVYSTSDKKRTISQIPYFTKRHPRSFKGKTELMTDSQSDNPAKIESPVEDSDDFSWLENSSQAIQLQAENGIGLKSLTVMVEEELQNIEKNWNDKVEIDPYQIVQVLDDLNTSYPDYLQAKYRYFRKECADIIVTTGVTIPFGVLEDRPETLSSFVDGGGPRFLLQAMVAIADHPQFFKSAISLLTTSMVMLKSKFYRGTSDSAITIPRGTRFERAMSRWAAAVATAIADESAVAICIHILVCAVEQSIREMTLHLLVEFLSISEPARQQMRDAPFLKVDEVAEKVRIIRDSEDLETLNKPLPRQGLPSTVAKTLTEAALFRFNNNFSGESFVKMSDKLISKCTKVPAQRKAKARTVTCLSLLFTVCGQHNNHFKTIEACVNVILSLLTTSTLREICEAIASAPACTLKIESNGSWKRSQRNDISSKNFYFLKLKKNTDFPTLASATTKTNKNEPEEISQSKINDPDWIGLKLLFKFLVRFRRYTISSRAEFECETVSMTSSQRETLLKTHKNIFYIICKLIIASPMVCNFVLNIPGAAESIHSSRVLAEGSMDLVQVHAECESALRAAAAVKAFKAEELRQTMKSLFVQHASSSSPFKIRTDTSPKTDDISAIPQLEVETPNDRVRDRFGSADFNSWSPLAPVSRSVFDPSPNDSLFLNNAFFRKLPDKPSLPGKIPLSHMSSVVQGGEGRDPLDSFANSERIKSATHGLKAALKKPIQISSEASARIYSVSMLPESADMASPHPLPTRFLASPQPAFPGSLKAHYGLWARQSGKTHQRPSSSGAAIGSRGAAAKRSVAGLSMDTSMVDVAEVRPGDSGLLVKETSLLSKTFPVKNTRTQTHLSVDFDILVS